MDVNALNSVSSNIQTTYSKATEEKKTAETTTTASKFSEEAATYDKSTDTVKQKTYGKKADNSALIAQLKADQEKMQSNLLDIVKKTIAGQGNAFSLASEDGMWKYLASGNFTADADTIAQAKKDIADDGYWGVDQTSSRIVDFAIALSGDDTSKADKLINAFKKGFDQATGAWGKKLPDISSKTYDAVMNKFDQWKNGTYKSGSNNTTKTEEATKTEG